MPGHGRQARSFVAGCAFHFWPDDASRGFPRLRIGSRCRSFRPAPLCRARGKRTHPDIRTYKSSPFSGEGEGRQARQSPDRGRARPWRSLRSKRRPSERPATSCRSLPKLRGQEPVHCAHLQKLSMRVAFPLRAEGAGTQRASAMCWRVVSAPPGFERRDMKAFGSRAIHNDRSCAFRPNDRVQ